MSCTHFLCYFLWLSRLRWTIALKICFSSFMHGCCSFSIVDQISCSFSHFRMGWPRSSRSCKTASKGQIWHWLGWRTFKTINCSFHAESKVIRIKGGYCKNGWFMKSCERIRYKNAQLTLIHVMLHSQMHVLPFFISEKLKTSSSC